MAGDSLFTHSRLGVVRVRGSFRRFMHRADDIVHGSKDRKSYRSRTASTAVTSWICANDISRLPVLPFSIMQTTTREKHLMPRGAEKKLPNSPMLLKNHWRHTKRNRKETVFRPSKN
ncbi:hypothetical protein HPB52_013077 [Rhipicephalus sanguineus]|uniref:Uncharacterized protein n=1 Tax=Rhipicephalus sanguineus TaxID=34632 RepID=A0A9D4PD04_RHISA|nr:hypothetical protein HPB52_013077 [Rhipicephalus sanguineus]